MPAEVDKTGEFFTFERGVVRGGAAQGGRKGFADVWLKDHFACEYKGPHKNLVDAYAQLQLYCENLENPPLSVVCDMDRFEVHTGRPDPGPRAEGGDGGSGIRPEARLR